MKKIVRLTESDLNRIIKRVLKEDIDFDVKDSRFGEPEIDIDSLLQSAYKVMSTNPKKYINGRGKGVIFDSEYRLVINGINIETFPDISKYKDLKSVSVTNCDIRSMPPASFLPKNIEILALNGNDIREIDVEDYIKLKNLVVLNVSDNPVEWVNSSVFKNMPSIIRVVVDGNPEGLETLFDDPTFFDTEFI